MELLNTALEYFTDLLKPRLHHYVSLIKDIMAAAVLLTALGSAVIGLIIFLPHFIKLFG
jgi:diacylglycerol kinase